MKPAFVVSFLAAAVLHALLLFGFHMGTPARPLPADDTAALDVSLVAAAPETPSVAPPPPEPAPPLPPPPVPPPVPPVPAPPTEMPPPVPEPAPQPAATPAPQPAKPRPVVQPPARRVAPNANPSVTPGGRTTTGPATTMHARYRSNPKPAYPIEARNLRQEGAVMLSVQVGADGRVVSVSVKRSSGYSSLDQAAVQGVRGWTFEPARAAGLAVASRVDVPVRFSLSER